MVPIEQYASVDDTPPQYGGSKTKKVVEDKLLALSNARTLAGSSLLTIAMIANSGFSAYAMSINFVRISLSSKPPSSKHSCDSTENTRVGEAGRKQVGGGWKR